MQTITVPIGPMGSLRVVAPQHPAQQVVVPVEPPPAAAPAPAGPASSKARARK